MLEVVGNGVERGVVKTCGVEWKEESGVEGVKRSPREIFTKFPRHHEWE